MNYTNFKNTAKKKTSFTPTAEQKENWGNIIRKERPTIEYPAIIAILSLGGMLALVLMIRIGQAFGLML